MGVSRPYFYHLSEGTDCDARVRYLDLEYEAGAWAINQNLIAIHCVGLKEDDFARMSACGGMVWSPLSNYLLYGATAKIEAAKKHGVRLTLGADWSPSGSKNLLGELKIAQIVSKEMGGLFSDEELVEMVTSNAAEAIAWNANVGSIEVGKKADLVVLEGDAGDPYTQLVQAKEDDIIAVLISGRTRLARQHLVSFAPSNEEIVSIGRNRYSLDLVETAADPLAGMSLGTAVAKLKDGLARLPDLAKGASRSFNMMTASELDMAVTIDLDMQDDSHSLYRAFVAKSTVEADKVISLELPPITEVDDAEFRKRLQANENLPDFLRQAL